MSTKITMQNAQSYYIRVRSNLKNEPKIINCKVKLHFFPKITCENTHTIDSKTHQSLRKLYFHVVLSSWYCCRIPGRCTKYEQSSLVLM